MYLYNLPENEIGPDWSEMLMLITYLPPLFVEGVGPFIAPMKT